MDGLVMTTLWRCAATTFSQESRLCFLESSICTAHHSCCQHKKGGLRDKPSKHPDAYHSCYNLVGLGAAQNYFEFVEDKKMDLLPLTAPYGWSWKGEADVPCEETDRVSSVHPVFVIPFEKVIECRTYFEEKEGF